ncbi:MAG: hypothetical protein KKH95_13165 [Gammaproteobacteria bacterium]|nr:hypothetical protein [Gammaproteobacteria bacterium]
MTWKIKKLDAIDFINYYSPNYLSVVTSMASATWNTVATHEVFTVTGLVHLRMWIECTATLTDAADAARIQVGYEDDTDFFITVQEAATAGAALLATGCIWYNATPTLVPPTFVAGQFNYMINGFDIGYEVTGAAFTGGSITWHCVWEPLNSTGLVVPGAGGVLV